MAAGVEPGFKAGPFQTAAARLMELLPDKDIEEWIEKVAETRDTDLRAHRVALTYHYFSRALDWFINGNSSVWSSFDDRTTVVGNNANWFNFATWATVTINRDLGLRRLPAGAGRVLPFPFRRTLTPLVLHARAADGQRVSRALSWGQRLVFLSTTKIFIARSMGTPSDPNELEAKKIDTYNWITERAQWDRRSYLDRTRHLDVVWQAFDGYSCAAHTWQLLTAVNAGKGPEDRKDRADLQRWLSAMIARCILAGNIMITAVEQDVVDEAVTETVDHIPDLISSAATRRMANWGERLFDVPREITGLDVPYQLERYTNAMKSMWARFMTDQILVMMLPRETLRMGRDIPALDAKMPFFPPELSDLTYFPKHYTSPQTDGDFREHAKWNRLLLDLVDSFDRSRADGRGTAARDWRNYNDRMNWAVNMMRTRQHDIGLFWCPYSEEDQRRIVAGQLPLRGGDPSSYEVEAPLDAMPTPGWRFNGAAAPS